MKYTRPTFEQMMKAKSLLGKDVTELEYADSIVLTNDKTYFNLISLDGAEILALVTDFV